MLSVGLQKRIGPVPCQYECRNGSESVVLIASVKNLSRSDFRDGIQELFIKCRGSTTGNRLTRRAIN